MHRFDYSFLDNGLLPAGLVNITADIYLLRERTWEKRDQFETSFHELEKIARVQSVKSSNEIEGIITTDDRILEIVNSAWKQLYSTVWHRFQKWKSAGFCRMSVRRRLNLIWERCCGMTESGKLEAGVIQNI